MSASERDIERETIREESDASVSRAMALAAPGDELAVLAIDQLGGIARSICNLAETLDARGDEIPSAIYGIIRDQMS